MLNCDNFNQILSGNGRFPIAMKTAQVVTLRKIKSFIATGDLGFVSVTPGPTRALEKLLIKCLIRLNYSSLGVENAVQHPAQK